MVSAAYGLAPKLVSISLLVTALVTVVMSNRAAEKLDETLSRAFESKGEAIALSLSAAVELVGGGSNSTVQGSMDSNKVIDGVRYIYVDLLDGAKPDLHTFSPSFPEGLQEQNRL